jgi:hypothetical protein
MGQELLEGVRQDVRSLQRTRENEKRKVGNNPQEKVL